MNLSRDFKSVQPGRYQNSINRTVDVFSCEIVADPRHPEDRSYDRKKWAGRLYKPDGKTVEQVMYFTDDGSEWGVNSPSTPMDLKLFNYSLPAESAA